jgi:aminomethyltransferase
VPDNPLRAVHVELGAFLVERAGTPVPARFGDVAAEHMAVRRAAGVFDLTSAGKFWVGGGERNRFLHALLTADVLSLAPGRGAYALLLTRDGRIASDARLAALADRILVLTPSISRGKVHRTFERHRVATDVTVEDATESWVLLTVQGPLAADVVGSALDVLVPDLPARGAAEVRSRRHGAAVLVRSPRTGEDGLDVLVGAESAPALFRAMVTVAKVAGGLPCGLDALDALRVETGRPSYGAEIDETTSPVDLPEVAQAVSLAKGCFLGRPEAERLLQQGRPVRRVAGVTFGGRTPAVRGDKLKLDDRVVGKVTTACTSPTLGRAIALAIVDADVAVPGLVLSTADGDTATVTALPFLAPKLA